MFVKILNQQFNIVIPRNDRVICLKESYLEFEFDGKLTIMSNSKGWTSKCSVNWGSINFISEPGFATSIGKHWENFSPAYFMNLMYKEISSSKDGDDLSTDKDKTKQEEKPNQWTKHMERSFTLGSSQRHCWVAEHQKNRTHALGRKLFAEWNKNAKILHRVASTDGRIIKVVFSWHVPHSTF